MARTGRPMRLDHVLDSDDDLNPITVADRVIQWLESGAHQITSAAAAGVHRDDLGRWLKEGARLEEALHLHPGRYEQLTDTDLLLLDFSRRASRAVATAEVDKHTLLVKIAEGGLPMERITEKYDAAGQLLERTVVTEYTLPSEKAIMWLLERRYPAHYAGTTKLDVQFTPKDPLSENERSNLLFDAIETTLATRELTEEAG